MILSKTRIQKLISNKIIQVTPDPEVKECSIKIHISNRFGLDKNRFEEKTEYILRPKEFVLARTREVIKLPSNIAGLYDGYIGVSSKGLMTHMCSMLIEPGFEGQILLEMFNTSDQEIVLKEGDRVGNLVFLDVE